MNFDYLLFYLDNSLLFIPNPSKHFDEVLVDSIKQLSSLDTVPEFQERYKFWFAEDSYQLLESWGVSDGPNFWKVFDNIDFKKRQFLREKNKLQLFNDVVDTIESILNARRKTALVSNTADYIVDYILDEFEISHLFHEKFGLDGTKDQVYAKPSPEGIKYVLQKLGFNAKTSRAIMIGDSIVDISAAKRANIVSCLIKRDLNKYPNGYHDWEHQPDYVIKGLKEILHL